VRLWAVIGGTRKIYSFPNEKIYTGLIVKGTRMGELKGGLPKYDVSDVSGESGTVQHMDHHLAQDKEMMAKRVDYGVHSKT
jgi:hypothetical protein